ncbi:MAG: hypothetical protein K8M05_28815 [Deltaproteobacteria bacterium]|nr:hypothetical protein [Kofleriaceae bacterium]
MMDLRRFNVRYAATWRLLAEIMRRHQAAHDLRLYWFYPGLSPTGVARLQRPDGTKVLDLDVAHSVVSVPEMSSSPAHRYVDALLDADDPKDTVDQIASACGLHPSTSSMPESNATVLCFRVIAGVLERRMLDRRPLRTSPGYVDNRGDVDASGWAVEIADCASELDRARKAKSSLDESQFVRHLFALHSDDRILAFAEPHRTSHVAFDFRTGVAHARHPSSGERSAISLRDLYSTEGRRLVPLIDWVERFL